MMAICCQHASAQQAPGVADAAARAQASVRAMRPEEKTRLTAGIMPLPFGANPPPIPPDAIAGAGYVPGVPRLEIPSLRETDASLGVAYIGGVRGDGATAMPAGVAMAATWNPELVRKAGAAIGAEAKAKGFNVLLAGGVNLMRDPRNGRTFEYFSEDPLLAGVLAGNAIAGVQSNHILSTIKHFALNGQETGRQFADVKISDAAARESDLLAFQIGIEIGNPGAVMCAYNRVGGRQACDSDYLLNRVLKQDWGYKGFVMSDWGAVPGVDAALHGLDQQSGGQLDRAFFLREPLAAAALRDPAFAARLDDMNRRILWAIYANGLDRDPARPGGAIDWARHAAVAEQAALQGIVLLRNEHRVLPLAKDARRILVVGGYANAGVLSGAGSSQVHGEGGPAVVVPLGDRSMPFANFLAQQYHAGAPLDAIRRRVPGATVVYRDGSYVAEAVAQAKQADVVILFATKWASEGLDQPDLTLPNGQDGLIEAVANANPNTIVVLETGNPVLMPWLARTGAVLEAWYPGTRGAEAIAAILFGEANPSGRLPISFPAREADLPRPRVDGSDWLEPNFVGTPPQSDSRLSVDYDIEGADVGYRWFARIGRAPLFPLGFGLSYTSFETRGLKTDGRSATIDVANVGDRPGATVVQLYLTRRAGKPARRLLAFQRVQLAPGEHRQVAMRIDPRLLAIWNGGGWTIEGGEYGFAEGASAGELGQTQIYRMRHSSWSGK